MGIFRIHGIAILLNRWAELLVERRALKIDAKWFRQTWPCDSTLKTQRSESKLFKYEPKISIVTPLYNTPEGYLKACVDSVLNQSYGNWEYCIVDDASTDPNVKKVIEEYCNKDSRIKFQIRAENGNISESTNSGIEMARGEFVAFLDHDDILWPNALYEVVKFLNQSPDTDVVYSDEDKIDVHGVHSGVLIKPEWSPELLLNMMYLSHFLVVRREVLLKSGGPQSRYNGTQDWEMVMRLSEVTDRIRHLPEVLYSWRVWSGSTAEDLVSSKPYALNAQVDALETLINRRGYPARVDLGPGLCLYHIRYITKGDKKVSVIISANYDLLALEKTVLAVLVRSTYLNYEVIVVANRKIEDAFAKKHPESFAKVRFMQCEQNELAKNLNMATATATGDFLFFVEAGIAPVDCTWIEVLIGHFEKNGIGCVGTKVLTPEGLIINSGFVYSKQLGATTLLFGAQDSPGYMSLMNLQRNVSGVSRHALMTTRRDFESIGGFDDKNFPDRYFDFDFCLRLREVGIQTIYEPRSEVIYFEPSLNKEPEDFDQNINLIKKWNIRYTQDPYVGKKLHSYYKHGQKSLII